MFSTIAGRMAFRNTRSIASRQLVTAIGRSETQYWTMASSAAVAATGVAIITCTWQYYEPNIVMLDAISTDGNVFMLGPTKEPKTGILFPALCNALNLVGTGVRVKYGFVKVYAVGTYVDPFAMSAVKTRGKDAIVKALLDPMYPRTIRIVMNQGLSIDKYTAGIVEALQPRMNGQDLEKLDEFKKLNPPVDLIKGAEMEMTIRGDVMLYRNSAGGVGQIVSRVFCEAMCDVYYGDDAVSPGHKDSVVEGIAKMK